MAYVGSTPRERATAAAPAAVVTGLLAYLLLIGLTQGARSAPDEGLKLFEPLPAAKTEPIRPVPARTRVHRRSGAAAPRGLRSAATELVAPPPIVPLPIPPALITAPVSGVGTAPTAGASDLPGPGPGAGGQGNGTGSGGAGNGDGDGLDTPPRLLRGRLSDRDWPADVARTGQGGVVSVRYTVAVNGRVTDCRVTQSSGIPPLDALTCRLIEERFRYRPALDEDGRPVPSTIVVEEEWVNELGPPDPEPRRRP